MESFEKSMERIREELQLEIGQIYEDCSYHPVICTFIDYEEDEIRGISLVNGTSPRSCSLLHCGVRKLTLQEAEDIKFNGPQAPETVELIPANKRWWLKNGI